MQLPLPTTTNLIGNLKLNPNHWGYRSLMAAIVPNGTVRPTIYLGPGNGPANNGRFPSGFTTLGTKTPIMGQSGFGFNFNQIGSQTIKTVNARIFGGLGKLSAIGRWKNNGDSGVFNSIFRKDQEFTAAQTTQATNFQSAIWTSTGLKANGYPLNFGTTDLIQFAATFDGSVGTGTIINYQSLNNGAISSSAFTNQGAGNLQSDGGTPFCIGGNESGTEAVKGATFHIFYFAETFSASQIASLFIDPAQIFLHEDDEIFATLVGTSIIPTVTTPPPGIFARAEW